MQIRTNCPCNNNYYIRQVSGGLNGAVQGKPTKTGANVLANCVRLCKSADLEKYKGLEQ